VSLIGDSQASFPAAAGPLYASAAIHPDGQHWALGFEGGGVQIGNLQTGEVIREFQASDRPIQSLAYHPGGERLAVAICLDDNKNADPCNQNEIRLLDLKQEPVQEIGCILTQHTDSIRSLAFSPDGKFLASGGEDRSIFLYPGVFEGCPAQAAQTLLATHSGGVTSLAFRFPAGDLLAAGGQDGKLAFWVAGTRQKIGDPILGNGGDLLSLAFSPDGKSLITGDEDGFVLLWDTDFVSWKARACQLAGRNLTQAEWRDYLSGPYLKTCEQWSEGP
jgi:WD40 repeat protein